MLKIGGNICGVENGLFMHMTKTARKTKEGMKTLRTYRKIKHQRFLELNTPLWTLLIYFISNEAFFKSFL